VAFAEKGHEVAICTSDKDCRQLINEKIHLYNARKDMIFGEKELLDDWGIAPNQVVDLLTLTGDSVDNVPGIPGIGVKTAAKLLQEHKTLEGVLAALPTMKKSKSKENIENASGILELSHKLVKLDTHVALDIGWTNGSCRTRCQSVAERLSGQRLSTALPPNCGLKLRGRWPRQEAANSL